MKQTYWGSGTAVLKSLREGDSNALAGVTLEPAVSARMCTAHQRRPNVPYKEWRRAYVNVGDGGGGIVTLRG